MCQAPVSFPASCKRNLQYVVVVLLLSAAAACCTQPQKRPSFTARAGSAKGYPTCACACFRGHASVGSPLQPLPCTTACHPSTHCWWPCQSACSSPPACGSPRTARQHGGCIGRTIQRVPALAILCTPSRGKHWHAPPSGCCCPTALAHRRHGLGRQAHAALAHPHVPCSHVALVRALRLRGNGGVGLH